MAALPLQNFAEVTFTDVYPGAMSATDAGFVQRVNYIGGYKTATVVYPTITYDQAETVLNFIDGLNGPAGSFTITVLGETYTMFVVDREITYTVGGVMGDSNRTTLTLRLREEI